MIIALVGVLRPSIIRGGQSYESSSMRRIQGAGRFCAT